MNKDLLLIVGGTTLLISTLLFLLGIYIVYRLNKIKRIDPEKVIVLIIPSIFSGMLGATAYLIYCISNIIY